MWRPLQHRRHPAHQHRRTPGRRLDMKTAALPAFADFTIGKTDLQTRARQMRCGGALHEARYTPDHAQQHGPGKTGLLPLVSSAEHCPVAVTAHWSLSHDHVSDRERPAGTPARLLSSPMTYPSTTPCIPPSPRRTVPGGKRAQGRSCGPPASPARPAFSQKNVRGAEGWATLGRSPPMAASSQAPRREQAQMPQQPSSTPPPEIKTVPEIIVVTRGPANAARKDGGSPRPHPTGLVAAHASTPCPSAPRPKIQHTRCGTAPHLPEKRRPARGRQHTGSTAKSSRSEL